MKVYESDSHTEKALLIWWKENKFYLAAVIAIIIISIAAVTNMNSHKQKSSLKAASLFYNIVPNLLHEQGDIAIKQTKDLQIQQPSSIYTSMSTFHLVKFYVNNKKYDEATKELYWLIDNSNTEIQAMAKLKLARILIELNQAKKAIEILQNNDIYRAESALITGDALMKEKEIEKAKLSYKKAKDSCNEKTEYELCNLIDMKFSSVNYVSK
ncbi:MAG: tetratricopeptide repeat protein [Pseudomonadota bacterium]|nr:tetratricopeptide repeat protein [Pseudomonadota bacterium]